MSRPEPPPVTVADLMLVARHLKLPVFRSRFSSVTDDRAGGVSFDDAIAELTELRTYCNSTIDLLSRFGSLASTNIDTLQRLRALDEHLTREANNG